jgi:hypothetical protein
MKDKNTYPIIKTSGLYYTHNGHTDAARFVRVFAETWRALPFDARRAMVQHWRESKADFLNRFKGDTSYFENPAYWPRIEVSRRRTLNDDGTAAVQASYTDARHNGWPLFKFWHFAVNSMRDKALAYLIAHELAHSYLNAIDDPSHSGETRQEWETVEEGDYLILPWEEEARQMTESEWGFDGEAWEQWNNENREALNRAAKEASRNE